MPDETETRENVLPEDVKFLATEYLRLWTDAGVELPHLSRLADKVACLGASGQRTLESVREWLGNCQRCRLSGQRAQIVFGSGNPKAHVMFVGEGPGAEEDRQGLPFVGRAGQLLTKIIEAMGLTRQEVYITNVVKCRPPENRAPQPDEIAECLPFLKAQIEAIQPKLIVALGLHAATTLTGLNQTISSLRGRFHPLAWNSEILVMPTYHPAYLLRNPSGKKLVWEDMKKVQAKMRAS